VQDTSQKAAPKSPGPSTAARPKPARQSEKQEAANGKLPEAQEPVVQKYGTSAGPKFTTFEVKLSILLRADQLEFLERLTRQIMKNRDKANRQERITKNTLVRACLDALQEARFDTGNIPDEEELRRRIQGGAANRSGQASAG
jgi:hypothetical protein